MRNGRREIWSNLAGLAGGLVVAGLCLWLLAGVLGEIDPDQIWSAATGTSGLQIAGAIIATALCYLALVLYDQIALRALGHGIPLARVFAGSFTAYALSHNLGLAPITASAARWKIYSRHGVSLGDIAKIVVLTGISFWMGVLVLAGAVLTINPQLVTGVLGVAIPDVVYRLGGICILSANIAYLVAIGKGFKRFGWKSLVLPVPSFRDALLQNGLGAVEIALASLALAILIPGVGVEAYPIVFLAYLLAFASVIITHAPGGVGVLELAVVAMMPNHPSEDVIAGLLLFRLVFHILPLLIALAVLAVNSKGNPKSESLYA